jgi:3-mercaptopyruvate sulfurtransferase SseA
VKLKRQLRQNQQKPQLLSNFGIDDNDDIIVDDDVTFGRNRQAKKFGKIVHEDVLSDYVKFRLWLARQLALSKYKEKWG